jgi:hypothetical protein
LISKYWQLSSQRPRALTRLIEGPTLDLAPLTSRRVTTYERVARRDTAAKRGRTP